MPIKITERHHKIKAKIEKPRIGGVFGITVHRADGTEEHQSVNNIIVTKGVKRLGDILAGVETTDIDLGFMEAGSSAQDPVIGDEDTVAPLTGAGSGRLAQTAQTRSATTPFEVVIQIFINSTILTRPQTIRELTVFFTPSNGDLFARGVLDTPIVLNASDTATLTYGIVFL